MKKIISFCILTFSFLALNAQSGNKVLVKENTNKVDDSLIKAKEVLVNVKENDNSAQDSNYLFKEAKSPLEYNLSMGASIGNGFWGERISSTYIAPSVRVKANEKAYVRAGVLAGQTTIGGNAFCTKAEDKAPYRDRFKHNAAYIGMDLELNPKLSLSVTAFYDVLNPMSGLRTSASRGDLHTYGFNANMTYEITKNSFLNFSFTYIDSNNPYSTFPNSYLGYSPINPMFSPMSHYNSFLNNNYFGW